MLKQLLTLAVALLLGFSNAESVGRRPISCSSDSYACGDNTKCVQGRSLCDYAVDCNDSSDEKLSLCKKFDELKGGCRIPGQVYSDGCKDIIDVCSPDYHHRLTDQLRSLCDEIKNGLAPNLDFVDKDKEITELRQQISELEQQSSLKGVFESVARGFADSMCPDNDSDCPWLYGKINGKCMALFTAAELTWFEAKEFCESVKGTLAIIDNMNDYQAVLEHLRNQELTTNIWIGGRYAASKSGGKAGWKWLNEKDIKMGVPYWSQYQSQNCTMRGTGPLCYTFALAPRENRDGFCLALEYAFHYYFIDQNCHRKRSPLCILNKK